MSRPAPGEMIVVWFSCGAASAVAAKRTIEKYGAMNEIRVVNNPVMEEHQDNRRFLRDVEAWIGTTIEIATPSKYPLFSAREVWERRSYMAGNDGAPCTVELKKRARQEWQNKNLPDWHVLGFTFDERHRHLNFIESEMSNVIPVLIDAAITKQQCVDVLSQAGIEPPMMYRLGFPNANCIGCVKATSPTYWNHVRKHFPEDFADRAHQSRSLGVRLVRVNNERIFLDELSPTAKGRPMKQMQIECGIFCEEKQ